MLAAIGIHLRDCTWRVLFMYLMAKNSKVRWSNHQTLLYQSVEDRNEALIKCLGSHCPWILSPNILYKTAWWGFLHYVKQLWSSTMSIIKHKFYIVLQLLNLLPVWLNSERLIFHRTEYWQWLWLTSRKTFSNETAVSHVQRKKDKNTVDNTIRP